MVEPLRLYAAISFAYSALPRTLPTVKYYGGCARVYVAVDHLLHRLHEQRCRTIDYNRLGDAAESL